MAIWHLDFAYLKPINISREFLECSPLQFLIKTITDNLHGPGSLTLTQVHQEHLILEGCISFEEDKVVKMSRGCNCDGY